MYNIGRGGLEKLNFDPYDMIAVWDCSLLSVSELKCPVDCFLERGNILKAL